MDVSITSERPAEDFKDTTVFRASQFFYDNWRETNNATTFDVPGYDHINSELINDTNTLLVLGTQASGNVGRSQGGVFSSGLENHYDGVTVVPDGTRLQVTHAKGLGNSGTETGAEFDTSGNVVFTGTATADTLDENGTVVADGGTLEIQSGIRVVDERLTITGDGVDGNGTLYSEGSADTGTRFGSSNNGDASTVVLDGDASIGVGINGNQLLAGRIQCTGDLTKLGAGTLTIGKSSNLDGNLMVAQGHITARSNVVRRDLTIASGASISAIGSIAFNTQGDVDLEGTLDLNSRTGNFISVLPGKIGRFNGAGQITATNTDNAASGGNLRIEFDSNQAVFAGQIRASVTITKSGTGDQVFSGSNTYSGTITISGGRLQVDGTHVGGGDYTIDADGTLGGNGAIDSSVFVNSGGYLTPGASAGTLLVNEVVFSSGAFFEVEIGGSAAGSQYDQLMTDAATLGGVLRIS